MTSAQLMYVFEIPFIACTAAGVYGLYLWVKDRFVPTPNGSAKHHFPQEPLPLHRHFEYLNIPPDPLYQDANRRRDIPAAEANEYLPGMNPNVTKKTPQAYSRIAKQEQEELERLRAAQARKDNSYDRDQTTRTGVRFGQPSMNIRAGPYMKMGDAPFMPNNWDRRATRLDISGQRSGVQASVDSISDALGNMHVGHEGPTGRLSGVQASVDSISSSFGNMHIGKESGAQASVDSISDALGNMHVGNEGLTDVQASIDSISSSLGNMHVGNEGLTGGRTEQSGLLPGMRLDNDGLDYHFRRLGLDDA